MKNKYVLWSAYLGSDWEWCPKLKEHLLSLDNIFEGLDSAGYDALYIEFDTLEELEYLIKSIPEEVYEDTNGWVPISIKINFINKEICLCDYYLD